MIYISSIGEWVDEDDNIVELEESISCKDKKK